MGNPQGHRRTPDPCYYAGNEVVYEGEWRIIKCQVNGVYDTPHYNLEKDMWTVHEIDLFDTMEDYFIYETLGNLAAKLSNALDKHIDDVRKRQKESGKLRMEKRKLKSEYYQKQLECDEIIEKIKAMD